jgi:hypothetical protein
MKALEILSQSVLSLLKWLLTAAVAIGVLAAAALGSFNAVFPEQRSADFEHLVIPDSITDCYACHAKMTPKLAHDWYQSKHGLMLVKCFVCHGQPDGMGSIPFTAYPDQRTVCRKCHDPAIQHAEENFGVDLDCNRCHPFHQNSLHHLAYERSISEREVDAGSKQP